ncbi:MAG: FAD:protein FMN transferase, partial [Alphaproteobacteria bacterium]
MGGAAALVVAWPGSADAVATIGGFAFGTYWRLGLGEDADHQRVRWKIMDIIEATDSAMSPFRPDAEITRINNTRSTDWMPASPQLRQVVGAAL